MGSTVQQCEYVGKKYKINASYDIMSTYREIEKNYLRASKGKGLRFIFGRYHLKNMKHGLMKRQYYLDRVIGKLIKLL